MEYLYRYYHEGMRSLALGKSSRPSASHFGLYPWGNYEDDGGRGTFQPSLVVTPAAYRSRMLIDIQMRHDRGNTRAVRMHLDALTSIVKLRGGLDALRMSCTVTMMAVVW
jgi:hypothetical protein